MNCLGPIVGPMEPGNRYPTEGSWSDWQACDRGWKICGLKTKVAPSLGITGISFKCCPSSKLLLFESKIIKKNLFTHQRNIMQLVLFNFSLSCLCSVCICQRSILLFKRIFRKSDFSQLHRTSDPIQRFQLQREQFWMSTSGWMCQSSER